MPDSNSNNPGSESSFNPDSNNNSQNKMYELISSYIDNELNEDQQKEQIKNQIDSNPGLYNRYIFEKLTKETLQKKIKELEVPLYLYKNIGEGIENIIKSSSRKRISQNTVRPEVTSTLSDDRSYFRKYFLYGGIAFAALIAFAFILNFYFKNNPEDLVAVSRQVFDKIESGDVELKYKCSNAKELEDSMDKYVDFKVYVPDLKDAVLIGGVCNEINGEKLAHFIYKKNNYIIYTIQGCKSHIMSNPDKIILNDEFKSKVTEGINWISCLKDKDRAAVVWYNDGVICSSVAHVDSQIISSTLKNTK